MTVVGDIEDLLARVKALEEALGITPGPQPDADTPAEPEAAPPVDELAPPAAAPTDPPVAEA